MRRALLILPLLLIACQGDVAPRLGKEFVLKHGETTVLDEQLTVKLVSITNESRCPAHLRCVWQGNAQVNLKVNKAGAAPSVVSVNTVGMRKYPRMAKYHEYKIELTGLAPHPKDNKPIPQPTYAASLLISK